MRIFAVIVLAFFSLIFFSYPSTLHAQGTFGCNYVFPRCRAGTSNCATGFTTNEGYCTSFSNQPPAVCNGAAAQPCIADPGSISSPLASASGPAFDCAGGKGIQTAIGCIPIAADDDGQSIASFFLKWGLGIAGGISLILIVYSGYMVATSFGDPRRLQAGKELLTAAISGLILLVMSAYILELIGVEILGIL